MAIEAPQIAKIASPGQFVHIRCSKGYNPLLRRPFSLHKIGVDIIEILFKVKGKGTLLLSKKKPGEKINILGPCGNGFTIKKADKFLLVAGGIGVAGLLALAYKLRKIYPVRKSLISNGVYPESDIKVFIGAKTKDHILCEEEFEELNCEVQIIIEDESLGKKGLVTEIFKDEVNNLFPKFLTRVYICGPLDMLRGAAKICINKKIPTQISFEQNMGCGIGVCLGCVVKTNSGYSRVCTEGPVFEAKQIQW